MQAVVHSVSVSPIFMWEWSPLAQLSSVTTPLNVCVAGAAARSATPTRLASRFFTSRPKGCPAAAFARPQGATASLAVAFGGGGKLDTTYYSVLLAYSPGIIR